MVKTNDIQRLFSIIGLIFLFIALFIVGLLTYEVYIQPVLLNTPRGLLLERLGIIFQLLAGLSIIIDIFGEDRISNAGNYLRKLEQSIRNISLPLWFLTYILWLIGIYILWKMIMKGDVAYPTELSCMMGLIALSGGAFTSFMAEHIIAFFSKILFVMLRLLPLKRLLVIVTLPIFIIGSLFQFLATFYP